VIYMSDNGAGGKRGPLQGGKGSALEAGIRVPMIVRGPKIEAGSHCGTPVVGTDWFPTFAAWAGVRELPPGLAGGDLSPLLHGDDAPVKRPHAPLFHVPHYQGDLPRSALLMPPYKLVRNWETGENALYHLVDDPGETRDLAATRAERAKTMGTELDRLLAQTKAALPRPNPQFDPDKVPDLKAGNKRSKDGGGKNKKPNKPKKNNPTKPKPGANQ